MKMFLSEKKLCVWCIKSFFAKCLGFTPFGFVGLSVGGWVDLVSISKEIFLCKNRSWHLGPKLWRYLETSQKWILSLHFTIECFIIASSKCPATATAACARLWLAALLLTMSTNFTIKGFTLAATPAWCKSSICKPRRILMHSGGEVEKQPGEEHQDQLLVLQQEPQLNCHSCVVHTLDKTIKAAASPELLTVHSVLLCWLLKKFSIVMMWWMR